MKPVLGNRRLPSTLRARFYAQGPLNILLYGCEGWALTKVLRDKLTTFHNNCARKLFGITRWHHQHEKIRLDAVFDKLELEPLETIIDKRTLDFLNKQVFEENNSAIYDIAVSHAEPKGKLRKGNTPMTTQKCWSAILNRLAPKPEMNEKVTAKHMDVSRAKKIYDHFIATVKKDSDNASRRNNLG